jgi:hypothetical protein
MPAPGTSRAVAGDRRDVAFDGHRIEAGMGSAMILCPAAAEKQEFAPLNFLDNIIIIININILHYNESAMISQSAKRRISAASGAGRAPGAPARWSPSRTRRRRTPIDADG